MLFVDIKNLCHQISGMIKTQIQVPEKQYDELRRFANERQWSMAETFRRGAELLLEVYPRKISPEAPSWQPPVSSTVEWMGLNAEEIKEAIEEDSEPSLEGPL